MTFKRLVRVFAALVSIVSVSIASDDLKLELPECGTDNIEVQFFNAYIDIENLPSECNSNKNLIDIGFLLQDVVEEVDGRVPVFREEKMLTTACPFPETIGSTFRYQATGRGERCTNIQAARRSLQENDSCSIIAEQTIKLERKAEYMAEKAYGIVQSMMERASNEIFDNVDLSELLQHASDGARICQESYNIATKAADAATKLCSLKNPDGSSSKDILGEIEVKLKSANDAVKRGKTALSRVKRTQHEMNVVYHLQMAQTRRNLQTNDRFLQEEEICSMVEEASPDFEKAEAAFDESVEILTVMRNMAQQLGNDSAASILLAAEDELDECDRQYMKVETAFHKIEKGCDAASKSKKQSSNRLKRTQKQFDIARSSAAKAVDSLAKIRDYQAELKQAFSRSSASITNGPTATPTSSPTTSPTSNPTAAPTPNPTNAPTVVPTSSPTTSPTQKPETPQPTSNPTARPTSSPAYVAADAQGLEFDLEPSAAPSSLFVKLLARPFEREYVTRLYYNLDGSNKECEGVAKAVQQKTIAEEALLASDEVYEEITELAFGHRGNNDVNRIRVDAFLSNIQIQTESAKAVAAAEMASELCSQGRRDLVEEEVESATTAANQTRNALADLKMSRDKVKEVVALITFDPVLSGLQPNVEEDEITLLRHLGEVETEVSWVDSQMQELPDGSDLTPLSKKRSSLVGEQMEIEQVLTDDVPFRISNSALKKDQFYSSVAPDFKQTPPVEYVSRSTRRKLNVAKSRQLIASKEDFFQSFGESLVENIKIRLLLGYKSIAGGCINEESDLSVVMTIREVISVWEQFDPVQCPTTFLARGPGRGGPIEPPVVPANPPTGGSTILLTSIPTSSPTVGSTLLPTSTPTNSPTSSPTSSPTTNPTVAPTSVPTGKPVSPPLTKVSGAIQDAYTRDGRYASRTLGQEDRTRLDVKFGDPRQNHNRRSFLQFDISEINGVVTKASIFLKVYGARAVPVLHNLHAVSDDEWEERQINWNNMPELGPVLDSQTIPKVSISEEKYFEYDVTSYVESKVSQGKDVFSVAVAADPSMWDLLIKYFSKEASSSDRPRFEVTYIPTD